MPLPYANNNHDYCATGIQPALLTVGYDSILTDVGLKYQACMVTYVCFEAAATGVAVNGNLRGDTKLTRRRWQCRQQDTDST